MLRGFFSFTSALAVLAALFAFGCKGDGGGMATLPDLDIGIMCP